MLIWQLSILEWGLPGTSVLPSLRVSLAPRPCRQPLTTSLAGFLRALASCDSPTFRKRVSNPEALVLASKIPKRRLGGGLAFLASAPWLASHVLKGKNPFFLTLNIFTAMRTKVQSVDPTLLPICTADTLRSAMPYGRFTRNCANAEGKESSCPQICRETALR